MRRGLGEMVLTWLSRDPSAADLVDGVSDWDGVDPWANLAVFPRLRSHVAGSDVLDFGCGVGAQSLACLDAGARSVTGIDTNPRPLAVASKSIASHPSRDRIRFTDTLDMERDRFDVILSQDSMEHFDDPDSILSVWRRVLRPDGRIYVTFGPPWYAPYGAHMFFFTKVPWVNLMFSEQTVMRVRSRYRSDGALRYGDVEGGLGKMTVGKFERVVKRYGFRVEWSRRDTVKGLPVSRVPLIRELLTNNIAAVLAPAATPGR